jgi:hypothetical protein
MQGIVGGTTPPPAYNVGVTACRSNWWPGSSAPFADIPIQYTFNISLFHPVGGLAAGPGNLGKFQATLSNGTLALDVRWGSDGLMIGSGIGSDTLIPGVVLEGVKQNWSFAVTGTSPALATVNVFLNSVLIASNVDCSWESTTAYDSLVIEMHHKYAPTALHKDQILSTTYVNAMDITYELETPGTEQNFYISSGDDAALIKIPLLNVDAGSFLINPGEPITLAHGYPPISIDPGSYIINGTSADLARGVFVGAESSYYDLTGFPVSFGRACVLDATVAATMALTGMDINLRKTTIFSAETNSFTLTGYDADLVYARKLLADPTSYLLTFMNTVSLNHNTFVFHAIINSDPYRMDIIPTDPTGLFAGFKLVPDPGAWIISGQDMSSYRQFIMDMGSESYVITGSPISFSLPDHVLAADEALYIIAEATNQELTFHHGYAIVSDENVLCETRPVGMSIRSHRHKMTERDHTSMTRRSGNTGFIDGRVIPSAEG